MHFVVTSVMLVSCTCLHITIMPYILIPNARNNFREVHIFTSVEHHLLFVRSKHKYLFLYTITFYLIHYFTTTIGLIYFCLCSLLKE